MRRPRACLAPLFALLFSCIFLLNLVSSLGVGQLAAYSETRSFRDALEGRSMEEAISGPVDKDTSSYGDRTSGNPNGSGQQTSQTAGGGSGPNYGGSTQAQGEAANSNAGQMMINIPANGNLNPTTTQQRTSDEPTDEQQQQSPANGGAELEREAGPISADFPIDTQQMSMEQKMKMVMKAKQMMAGRSGRLTGPMPSSAMMMEMMMRTMKEEAGRRKRMNRMGARSGRLRQEQQQEDDQQQQKQQSDKSDEENNNRYGPSSMNGPVQMASAGGYGKKMAAQTMNQAAAYDGNMQNNDGQQQQQTNGGQESGYENQSEQEEMLGNMQQMSKMAAGSESMRAKYNRMMNGAGMDDAYKHQQANMGQSMMMSLANKAAYMANQKSRRQVVPMMMMRQNGDGASGYKAQMPIGATMSGGSYGQNGEAMSMQMPMKRANYQSMGAMGAMRAMRRANQRRTEKKISPAMMNAMLNKMLASSNGASGRQYQAEEPAQKTPASSGNYGAGQQMSKMRAELMAQMMMMKMNAANGNGYGGAMGSSNGNSNKLYKLMSTMQQQQQQQMKDESEDEQKAMTMNQMNGGSNYGDRSPASNRPMMMANGYSSQEAAKSSMGYGQDSMSGTTTPSSYEGSGSMGPSTSSRSPMAGYGSAQQMPMGSATAGYDNQEQQQQQEPMSGDTKGMQQPVMMMQPVMKSYGMSSPATMSPMMASVRMAPKMTGYGGGSDSTSGERPTNGKLMQQVMKMMRAKQMAMGGQGKSAYGAGDQQQQQQTEAKDYGADSQGMQSTSMAYGTKSAPSPSDTQTQEPEQAGVKGQPMNRPTMPMSMGMSYDSQDQQQQQQMGSGDAGQDQQQQVGDYGQGGASGDQYGAAPMGQAEPFAFDYKVEDEATGNNQYRKEESDKNGVVRGSYGYMDSNSGVYRHVEYVADENGFRANIKSNEPGLSDKATSGGGQQPEMAGSRSGSGESMGTKSADAASYQPARSPSDTAPPSSSSSLGGSAALQQESSKTSAPMEDQMALQPMQMAAKMPQEQQQTSDEKK